MAVLYYRRILHLGTHPDTVDLFFVPTRFSLFARRGFSLEIHRGYNNLVVFTAYDGFRKKYNPGQDVPKTAEEWYSRTDGYINTTVLSEDIIQISHEELRVLRETASSESKGQIDNNETVTLVEKILTLPRILTIDRLASRKTA